MPPSRLRGRLDDFRPSGGTAIYDALVASAPLFTRRTHTRTALVVISDGADTASDRTLQQARDVLRRSDPFVYAIAIDSVEARESTRVNPEALREITGPSGGYTEVVRSPEELGPATERIATELNSQYTLGYTPSRPPDGEWRGIRVRIRDRSYFTRARRGYFASPSTTN
jgi:Ca-activated chloride channel family protein